MEWHTIDITDGINLPYVVPDDQINLETNKQTPQQLLSQIWDCCDSRIYYVVSRENQTNTKKASLRHLRDRLWLYLDDIVGYEIIGEDAMRDLAHDPNCISVARFWASAPTKTLKTWGAQSP